jgi:hypothetical protein
MSGCIIPVAPDFQDPVGSPNYAPVLSLDMPPFGSFTQLPAPAGGPFSFDALDPNAGDHLYVNWVVDRYMTPSLIQRSEAAPSTNPSMNPTPAMFSLQVSCLQLLAMTAASIHTLEAIVSDRAFVAGTLDQTMDPNAKITRGDWFFTLTCAGGTTASP